MGVNVPFPLDAARQAGDIFTGPVFFAPGIATLPSIAFSGDPDTGIFSPAADTFAIATGGFERVRAFGAAADDGALEFEEGVSAAVSAVGKGAIRYNNTTKTYQVSLNGAPYVDLSTGAGVAGVDSFRFVGSGSVASIVGLDGAWVADRAGTIKTITLHQGTAGGAGSTIIDVNINGVTIFTNQANRPTVTAAQGNDAIDQVNNMDITAFVAGDQIKVDVDTAQTGPAKDVSVTIAVQY